MNARAITDSIVAAHIVESTAGIPLLEVIDGKERSHAIMVARRTLARELMPTVLVLDSESLEDRTIMEAQLEIGGILESCSRRIPYRLILAIPQVESILFSDREGFERALGRTVVDLDWFEARFRPRTVLRRLLEGDFNEAAVALIDRLDAAALRRMGCHPVVREIRGFMTEVRRARIRRTG
jgi:hypothetical protein